MNQNGSKILKTLLGYSTLIGALSVFVGTLSSCGKEKSMNPTQPGARPGQPSQNQNPHPNEPTFPASSYPQTPYPTVNGLSLDELNRLKGIYDGAFLDENNNSLQPYTFNISQARVDGQPNDLFAYLWFDSDGQQFNGVHFEGMLKFDYAAVQITDSINYNYVRKYYFHTQDLTINNAKFTEFPFSLNLVLAFQNGTNFDPMQSLIHFKDCKFSSGSGNCSSDLPDVSASNPRKR